MDCIIGLRKFMLGERRNAVRRNVRNGSFTKRAAVFDNPTIHMPTYVATPFKGPIRDVIQAKFSDLAAFYVSSTLFQSRRSSNLYVLRTLNSSYSLYVPALGVFETLNMPTPSGTFWGSSPL